MLILCLLNERLFAEHATHYTKKVSLGLCHLGDSECCLGGRTEVLVTLEWQFHHVYNLGALCNKDELWQWCFVAEIFNG